MEIEGKRELYKTTDGPLSVRLRHGHGALAGTPPSDGEDDDQEDDDEEEEAADGPEQAALPRLLRDAPRVVRRSVDAHVGLLDLRFKLRAAKRKRRREAHPERVWACDARAHVIQDGRLLVDGVPDLHSDLLLAGDALPQLVEQIVVL
jgi:hypothetical protein